MVFDPVTWGAGYIASRAANRALGAISPDDIRKKIEGELNAWAGDVAEQVGALLPAVMSTLFDGSGGGPRRQELRKQLERHELPDARSWTAAALERWEEVHALGDDAQSFFRLDPEVALPFLEDLGRRLATIVAGELELLGPAVIRRLDTLDAAEARKYLREISPQFIEENRVADIRKVLGAAVGDWPLVSQDHDFRRQLESELLARIEQALHPGLLIILGDAGAGKTTLLRRLGLELLRRGRRVLELRAAARKSGDWVASVPQPDATGWPCILIDDIFRCDGIEDILAEGNAFTIIGTSRINEDQTAMLRFSSAFGAIREGSRWPVLTEPTTGELEQLHALEDFKHIPDSEWRRIVFVTRAGVTRPAPLLVLLLQLAAGKPYDEIVLNSVASLKAASPAWHAYGAICAFHQYGVAVPTEVLTAILRVDRQTILAEQEHGLLRGMVFRADAEPEAWVTAHELLAESAAELAYGALSGEYRDAAFALAQSTETWWRLLLDLVRALVRAKRHSVAHALTVKYSPTVQAMLDADATRRCDWARVLSGLTPGVEARAAVKECIRSAVPGSPTQLVALVEATKFAGATEREEFHTIEPYIDLYPSAFVVERYLTLVVRVGETDDRAKAIRRAIAWSYDPQAHPNVLTVVMAYLDREPAVAVEQRAAAAARLYQWVKEHPQALVVWRVLVRHYRNAGNDEITREVLGEAMKYFAEDKNFLTVYIAMFDQELTPEAVESLYEGLIARMSQDSSLTAEYVKWLDQHGFATKALAVADRTEAQNLPTNYGFRYRYGMLLLRAGRIDDAERQARIMIDSEPSQALGYGVLGTVMAKRAAAKQPEGDVQAVSPFFREAEAAYREAIRLDRLHGKAHYMNFSLLGALYLSFGNWPQAYRAYHDAADLDPDNTAPYIGMARAATAQKHWRDANAALRNAAEAKLSAISPEFQQQLSGMLEELTQAGDRIAPKLLREVKAKVAGAPVRATA